jgi:predicted O-linked N-acetylglucosamine transferase (SPINDLY family)
MTTINRNDPCPCGSGKKYKHCCQAKDAAQAVKARASRAFIPGTLQMAVQYHQKGQLSQAQALYRQILQADPAQPDALQLLGLIEHQQGHSAVAVELIQRAIQARPQAAMYHFNLGNTLQDMGQFDAAANSYRKALALQPNFPDASYNLGNALKDHGQLTEAIASYRQSLFYNPGFAEAYLKIGNVLIDLDRIDEAIASFRQTLVLQPAYAEAHYNLGTALIEKGLVDEAIASFRQALMLKPDHVDTLCNYARARLGQGHCDEAIACYRRAILLKPDYLIPNTSLLFALQNNATCSAQELFQEHLNFAERFEAPLKRFWQPHSNPREHGRRLKVGYVSGDFCNHPVAYFLDPILACHDKAQVEIYGYYNHTKHDAYTDRIHARMDHWLPCKTLSDEQLAERIRADGIDILVDLSGHTAHNRLLVFARKPAPVQATYIGYPGTTGLSSIDYRISDPWQDPPGLTERYHSETLVRIPGGMAFSPYDNAPDVNALPALTSGALVLACLNNMSKVGPAVINLWARILHALPQARLMLGNMTESGLRQHVTDIFGQAGIGPERLILQPRVSVTDYLAIHHQIDLALDPFPYNGGTTTMHSLWMGVPVITLAGDHAVSRLCAAHLSRVGLDEFITHTEDEYLQRTIQFANDLPALNQVRQSLRARMSAPECQPATITRHLEAAYREMWQKWCNS